MPPGGGGWLFPAPGWQVAWGGDRVTASGLGHSVTSRPHLPAQVLTCSRCPEIDLVQICVAPQMGSVSSMPLKAGRCQFPLEAGYGWWPASLSPWTPGGLASGIWAPLGVSAEGGARSGVGPEPVLERVRFPGLQPTLPGGPLPSSLLMA